MTGKTQVAERVTLQVPAPQWSPVVMTGKTWSVMAPRLQPRVGRNGAPS